MPRKHASTKNFNLVNIYERISLTTLEAVPPGQQPSNIKPTEREGESPNDLLTINAKTGIIVY